MVIAPGYFPTVNMKATGENILKIRKAKGLSVKDIQMFFGFDQPQAIYKWQWGECLPSVDNLFALSMLFELSIDQILIGNNQDFLLQFYWRIYCFWSRRLVK